MTQLQTKLPTDTWVTATWDEYIRAIEDPYYTKAKGYYYNGQMRIEAMGVGPDHASYHGIISFAITLFCTINRIPLQGLINCSYRKTGVRECQPDKYLHRIIYNQVLCPIRVSGQFVCN